MTTSALRRFKILRKVEVNFEDFCNKLQCLQSAGQYANIHVQKLAFADVSTGK